MGEYGVKEQNQLARAITKDSAQRAAYAEFIDNRPQAVIQARLIQAMQERGVKINSTGFDNRNKYRTLPARRIISEIPRHTMQATFDSIEKVEVTTDLILKIFQNICEQRFNTRDIGATLLLEYYSDGIDGICTKVISAAQGRMLSEYQIADIIVHIPEIERMIKKENIEDKKTQESPTTPLSERLKNIAYRHYTTDPESIFASGLDPNYDQGNGIAMNGVANAAMAQSFAATSKHWAYVTRSGKDIKYSKDRKVVDVFILPGKFEFHMNIDVDSHGYKSDEKLNLIGYKGQLNPTATRVFSAFFNVTSDDVQTAYSSMRPQKTLPPDLSSSSQSPTDEQPAPKAEEEEEVMAELEIQTKNLDAEVNAGSGTGAEPTPEQQQDLQKTQVLAIQKTGEDGLLNKTLSRLRAHPVMITAAITGIIAFIFYLLSLIKRSK